MFELIVAGITEAITWIVGIWESFAEIRYIGRFVKGIACMAQWYAYLQLILKAFEFLEGIGIPEEKIIELLGLRSLVGDKPKNVKKTLSDSLNQAVSSINDTQELNARLQMAPSSLNGTHKPPYHSIAIHEVLYEYSNVAGTGAMVIVFNPEGFGMNPREPMIVRYVDEAEFNEFINAKSWGNYWRLHYLSKGARGRRRAAREARATNPLTGLEGSTPISENLSGYVERALDLPDEADGIIAGEFQDMIVDAFDKQIDLTNKFATAIEKGGLGRGVEQNGLRVTSALGEGLRAVPGNLKGIITRNPIIKDVAGLLPTVKIQLNRMRNLRTSFSSATHLSSLTAEGASAMGALGGVQAALTEAGIATDFAFKIGQDLTIESARAGSAAKAAYDAAFRDATDLANTVVNSIYGDYGLGQLSELSERTAEQINDLIIQNDIIGGLDGRIEELSNFLDKSIEFDNISEAFRNGEASLEEFFEAGSKIGAITGELGLLSKADIAGEIGKGFIKPPTCIPFIK